MTAGETRAARASKWGVSVDLAPPALGQYHPVVVHGSTAYTAGHGPIDGTGSPLCTGRLGADLTVEQGHRAAQAAAGSLLASLMVALGSLDRIDRILQLTGYITATADFHDQPLVLNGASEVLIDVLGAQAGVHARTAIGVNSCVRNLPVTIDAVLAVDLAAMP